MAAVALICLAAVLGGAVLWRSASVSDELARLARPDQGLTARLVLARDGQVLRWLPDDRDRRYLPLAAAQIPDRVGWAFLAAEDARFFEHRGVDWRAILRALRDDLAAGRIVSGGSTITMQLIRLLEADQGPAANRRSLTAKVRQTLKALRLEAVTDKETILTAYLNRVPLGHNLYGLGAAAQAYFGLTPAQLSPAQAALLAALPKAPGLLGPYSGRLDRLKARRDWVLGRMRRLGRLDEGRYVRALAEPIRVLPRRFPNLAPHAVDAVLSPGTKPSAWPVKTTLDVDLQAGLEAVLASHRVRLEENGASQAAAIIMETATGRVLALAGSLKYAAQGEGFVNGAAARRSAGSVLKPLLYALALDSGVPTARPLPDFRRVYSSPGGEYRPENFDRATAGPVSMRRALTASLNLPAVALLARLGVGNFKELLVQSGLLPAQSSRPLGLGLAVGNAEIRLIDLAAALAALANQGVYNPPSLLAGQAQQSTALFSPQAAFIARDILSDVEARRWLLGELSVRFGRALVKTGTSTSFRDGWCVAADKNRTVAVWVGNFDGQAMDGLTGSSGAAPITADIWRLARPGGAAQTPSPVGVIRHQICAVSGAKPGPYCPAVRSEWFINGLEPDHECTYHRPGPQLHRLPRIYADWVYERRSRHQAGRWRLAGPPGATAEPRSPAAESVAPGRPVRLGQPPTPLTGRRRGGVRIAYPLPGDSFLTGPDAPGRTIQLKARSREPVDRVTWVVDGVELASVGPPYHLDWQAQPGRHRIAALGPDGLGQALEVVVR